MSPKDRKQTKLGDIIKVKHGRAFKGEFFSDSGNYILLTPGNFTETDGLKFKGDKEKYYTGNFPKEYLLKKGDLLIAMTDLKQSAPYLGAPGIIVQDNVCLHNQRLGLVEIIKENVYKGFLYYVFNDNNYRSKVRGSATGATVKHTAPERIYNIDILLPPLPTQQAIASILSKYDDLIGNNNQRIKILEQEAELIYKEWFVKFKFPGWEKVKMVDSGTEFGLIPEGWEIRKIKDICDIKSGFAFKTDGFDEDGQYGLVTIKNVQDGFFVPKCTDYFSVLPSKLPEYCMLKDGDILLSLTGNVGRTCLVYGDNFVLNQRVAKLIAKNPDNNSFLYYLFKNSNMRTNLEGISKGAAQQNLSPIETGELSMCIPDEKTIKSFEKVIGHMIREIILLNKQNENLKQTRDMLLPKLMDREVEI